MRNNTPPLAEIPRLKYFAVWGVDADGACLCPKGLRRVEDRDARWAVPGECSRPGKHPVVLPLRGGGLFGFPRGLNDALPWDELVAPARGLWPSARAVGGRLAVALPGDVWVLDVDSPAAWSGLVKLFKAGAVTFDRLLAVARTPRGWHVWVQCGSGWRTGVAQSALNAALDAVRAPRGLEVKTGGGYVVIPDGIDRFWMEVRDFADIVAGQARTVYGWGAIPVVRAAALGVEDYSGETGSSSRGERPAAEDEWVWPSDVSVEYTSGTAMSVLRIAAAAMATVGAGKRNNALNRLGYIEGRDAVDAGCEVGEVVEVLRTAGLSAGLSRGEVERTIRSALSSSSSLGEL